MDIKKLFHSPSELSDDELSQIRSKIRMQRATPFLAAGISTLFVRMFDATYYRSGACPMRLGAAALSGYALGAMMCDYYKKSAYDRTEDAQIMQAYEMRQIDAFTAASGLRDAIFVSKHHNLNDTQRNKPY